MIQVVANALISASLYSLIALGFGLLYQTERFFNFSLGAAIAIGAYAMLFLAESCGASLLVAIPASVILTGLFAVSLSSAVFHPLQKKGVPSWGLLIVSLGLYTIIQNTLSLAFGDNTRTVRTGTVAIGHNILGAFVTDVQLTIISSCAVLFALAIVTLNSTPIGRAIRGVSSNPELCGILGLNVRRTILWAVFIGGAFAGIAGVLYALDTDMNPTMGFRLLMSGVVVFIIGGVGSYRGLVGAALLLALGQHFAAFYLDSRWMEAAAFILLVGFLIRKPLGFTGRWIRKVEV